MSTKVGVVSLGCDKNRVDTEVMLSNLQKGGYEIVSQPQFADVIIVNSCAFLESARKEALDTVFEMANYKSDGACKKVILTGCLGEKFGQEVLDGLYEVDAVVGTQDYGNICKIVEQTLHGQRNLYHSCNNVITFGERVLTTPKHYAYLKIADGCDNYCTYCLIPYIRGRFRSVPIEQIIEHATQLAQSGVKELILVAQDVTRYGKDLYGSPQIVQLLQKLSQIDGISLIRLLYCYPELVTDSLIDEIVNNNKIAKYLDIPLQHVNDSILRRMNRRSDYNGIVTLFDKLQAKGIAVRSTFICGFPNETQDTIDDVSKFLQKYKLRNVGFFAYSREDGTPSAKFDGQIPQRTKQKYVKQLYSVQHKVVELLNTSDIGKTYRTIIDSLVEQDENYYHYCGRTEFMSPDIDGNIFVISSKPLQIGDMYNVTVTDALEYDLIGEVKKEEN